MGMQKFPLAHLSNSMILQLISSIAFFTYRLHSKKNINGYGALCWNISTAHISTHMSSVINIEKYKIPLSTKHLFCCCIIEMTTSCWAPNRYPSRRISHQQSDISERHQGQTPRCMQKNKRRTRSPLPPRDVRLLLLACTFSFARRETLA